MVTIAVAAIEQKWGDVENVLEKCVTWRVFLILFRRVKPNKHSEDKMRSNGTKIVRVWLFVVFRSGLSSAGILRLLARFPDSFIPWKLPILHLYNSRSIISTFGSS